MESTQENRKEYTEPKMIIYGSVSELAMGGGGNVEDTNTNNPYGQHA